VLMHHSRADEVILFQWSQICHWKSKQTVRIQRWSSEEAFGPVWSFQSSLKMPLCNVAGLDSKSYLSQSSLLQ